MKRSLILDTAAALPFLALAMVVVVFRGAGLGQPVLRAIADQYYTFDLFNGFAIVGGKRLQKHQEASHG